MTRQPPSRDQAPVTRPGPRHATRPPSRDQAPVTRPGPRHATRPRHASIGVSPPERTRIGARSDLSWQCRCLHSHYAEPRLPCHRGARNRCGRRAAPACCGSPHRVAPHRSRSRRSPRRGGCAPSLRPRSHALHVRVLHRTAAPLRGRGLSPDSGGPCFSRAPWLPGDAGRRPPAPQRDRATGSPPHSGEPGRPATPGDAPDEARDRRGVAELAPRADVPACIRKLPAGRLVPRTVPNALAGVPADGTPLPAASCSPQRAAAPLPSDLLRPERVDSDGSSDADARGSALAAESATLPREQAVETRAAPPGGELRLDLGHPWVPARRHPATVEPLSPARYKVEFTASSELRDKLVRLQDLMRSSVPSATSARSSRPP